MATETIPLPIEIVNIKQRLAPIELPVELRSELDRVLDYAMKHAKVKYPAMVDDFGKFMRELRESKGIKQLTVARKLGIRRDRFGHIEQGRQRPPSKIVIGQWLELLGESDKKDEAVSLAQKVDEHMMELRRLRKNRYTMALDKVRRA